MYLLLVKDFKIGTRNFPCCKMQIVLKDKTRLGDNFYFQRPDSQDLTLMSFTSFSVDSAMGTIMMNALDTWLEEMVNILVHRYLPKNKLSLSTAP